MEWISCSERKPVCFDEDILVFYDGGYRVAEYDGRGFYTDQYGYMDVTHWAELELPPAASIGV